MNVTYREPFVQVECTGPEASRLFMALRDINKATSRLFEDEAGPGLCFGAGGLTYMLQDHPTEGGILTVFRDE